MNAAKLGLKEVRVHFGAFDFDLLCVVGHHRNLARYVAFKHNDPDFDADFADYRGVYFTKRGYCPIIWIPRKPRTPAEHGTLAHEVMHAVRFMLVDWARMELTRETDEVFCHALGTGVREILKALR